MKRPAVIYIFLLCFLAFGCKKSDGGHSIVVNDGPVPVTLKASGLDVPSKAAVDKWNGNTINVYGLIDGGQGGYDYDDPYNIVDCEVILSSDPIPTVRLLKDSDTPYCYKDEGQEDYVYDFFAYHLGGAVVKEQTKEPGGVSMLVELSGSNDLMYAHTDRARDVLNSRQVSIDDLYSADAARHNVHPTLIFEHALSRFNFIAKGAGSHYGEMEIIGLQVMAHNTGRMSLADESVSFEPIVDKVDPVALSLKDSDGGLLKEITLGENELLLGGEGACIMIPSGFTELPVTLKYRIKETREEGDYGFTVKAVDIQTSQSKPSDSFQSGVSYDIIMNIFGPEQIRVTCSLKPWADAGQFEVDPDDGFTEDEEEVTEYHYIDENGYDWGPGVEIDGVLWAPVNCGYNETDYTFGKLFQWGRKYGQGHDAATTRSSASFGIKEGPVSVIEGMLLENSDVFFTNDSDQTDYPNWTHSEIETLWNLGTEDSPIKTEYDPCPQGWRVPTIRELDGLCSNSSDWISEMYGYWFCGSAVFSEEMTQKIFLSASGYRKYDGSVSEHRTSGCYWSSSAGAENFYMFGEQDVQTILGGLASAFSIRCVKNDSELVPVKSLGLTPSEMELAPGDSQSISTDILPYNSTHKTAFWHSSDENVVVVDKDGKVTAIAVGDATVTAMAGMQTATCSVTVRISVIPVTGVTLDKTSVELYEGDKITLIATVLPADASNRNVTWSSSNLEVATVEDGLVTALKEGEAVITVTTEDGAKTATCTVKVNAGNNEKVEENEGIW